MKTSLNARNRFSEGPAPCPEEESRDAALPNGYRVIGLMRGLAASLGVATGRATVVMDSRDIPRVNEGAVIVSKEASPDLAMVMPRACALATEFGGLGATASAYARACGIPAVVGIAGLTRVIRDGDLVRVDGTRGTVEIIESAS